MTSKKLSPPPLAPWVADLGDGTYQNPVLFADYSDPDVVRVGDDFWLTASSFNHVPGLPLLHSRDLVSWTLVGHALRQLVPARHYATPRHGGGVWAPAIRYHGGKYWIYYPDPDFGIYVLTADDPRGRWTDPVLVCGGKGLIDPCPLWDHDGRVYLVHAWARSRAGISNRLTLRELSPDGQRTVGDGAVIIDGDRLPDWHTIEGPKLYRRSGWYYVFAPAGGVANGFQAVFRSRDIHGPYEARVVLAQGNTPVNGPHQGAWVDTAAGEHWFLHFQDRGAYGRVVHLQPMRWRDDWPIIGEDPDGDGKGQPVLVHRKPAVAAPSPAVPASRPDEFKVAGPGLQWQWQANPPPAWGSLSAAGTIHLAAVPAPAGPNLWPAPNLLLQKFAGPAFTATTRLALAPAAEGDQAGLIVFGHGYAWIGIRQTATGPRVVLATCRNAADGAAEQDAAACDLPGPIAYLRVSVDDRARCRFAYSLDGLAFDPLGGEFHARQGRWVGAKVGLFATGRRNPAQTGHAEFGGFHVTASS